MTSPSEPEGNMADYSIGKLTRTRSDGSQHWAYCIVWWEDGKRKRLSLKTDDRVCAEIEARRYWERLAAPHELRTVGDIVGAYLGSDEHPRGVPDDKRKREAWKAAKPYWGELNPRVIDEQVSLRYPSWRKRSINTHRAELSVIRTALNWAVKEGKLEKAPKVTLPPQPESSAGHLTKDEFRRFLEGCVGEHVRLFAMLAVTTGGRKSAILEAKWEQVDFKRGLIQLNPAGRRQNSKFRSTVPLNALILPALKTARQSAAGDYIIEHRGVRLLDIKKGIQAAGRRSGVRVHPHMFRHSAAVWMAEDRVPMAEIAAYLGHRDINVTTRIYARYHPDYLREAAQSLMW